MLQFNERIKFLREEAGISQAEFAQKAGVSLASQQNYERGARVPDAVYIIRLHEAGFDTNFLITGEKPTISLTEDEKELLNEWRQAKLVNKTAAFNALLDDIEYPRVMSSYTIHYQQGDGGGHTEQGDINHYQGDDKRGSRIRNSIGNITGSVIKNIKQGE